MEIINLLGIKKFMECIISQNIDFNYTDNKMTFSHESYIDLTDYQHTLADLELELSNADYTTNEYKITQSAIELLRDLIQKLESKI